MTMMPPVVGVAFYTDCSSGHRTTARTRTSTSGSSARMPGCSCPPTPTRSVRARFRVRCQVHDFNAAVRLLRDRGIAVDEPATLPGSWPSRTSPIPGATRSASSKMSRPPMAHRCRVGDLVTPRCFGPVSSRATAPEGRRDLAALASGRSWPAAYQLRHPVRGGPGRIRTASPGPGRESDQVRRKRRRRPRHLVGDVTGQVEHQVAVGLRHAELGADLTQPFLQDVHASARARRRSSSVSQSSQGGGAPVAAVAGSRCTGRP